jgi:L-gulonate 3-dehydrogenase
MKSAAIVGAGLVGQAWAIVFARAGWLVRIFEPNEEVRQALPDGLRRMADELTFSGLAVDSGFVISNISIIDRIEEALEGVDFVQESGPELVEVKKSIFADCDRIAPRDAILASSSSAITASRFSEHLASRERCLISRADTRGCASRDRGVCS